MVGVRCTGPQSTDTAANDGSKNVILFLASDPVGTTRLAVDEECAAIERELRMTYGRHNFALHSRWAVTIDEMMRHLNELEPRIVHFSGHGGRSERCGLDVLRGEHRASGGLPASAGIQLRDEQRRPRNVTARALARMIGSAAPSTRLVVLNACFSHRVARSLRGVVDCVVGMRGAIGDEAAHAFAASFYRALGFHRSVGNAVAQAVATLAAKQFPDEHLPVCVTRNGVCADEIVLSR
jgi:CHAT domain